MSARATSISLGCRLNAYESERMAQLAATHLGPAAIVVNTCGVTAEAVRQSRQAIRKARAGAPDAPLIVTGCAADIDPSAFTGMPEITARVPNAQKLDPVAWANLAVGSARVMAPMPLDSPPSGEQGMLIPARPAVRAALEVQNGCDHACTFCIIPRGRGVARSRPIASAVAEAQALAEAGASEIVLTGVDLTSFGPDLAENVRFAHLVEALLGALPSAVRLRLSSIDGAEVDAHLFGLVTTEARIAPHLHLSLQSGDDMILKRMKRRHDRAGAVRLAIALKAARPEMALGADLIAGFPTETAAMFDNTRQLIADAGLSFVHVFPYSPRAGTPAARMPQLDRAVVQDRARQLRLAADAALHQHLAHWQDRVSRLLVEQVRDGRAIGKLPDFTDAALDAPAAVGSIINVRIIGAEGRAVRVAEVNA